MYYLTDKKEVMDDLTHLESLFEIRAGVLGLQKYLSSKDKSVAVKAQKIYIKLVERYLRENESTPEIKNICLADVSYFLQMLDNSIETQGDV